jgi:DNA-binding IscR family transcriptional regulator
MRKVNQSIEEVLRRITISEMAEDADELAEPKRATELVTIT